MLVKAQPLALSRHNNFDLIRLLAAYQVVAIHVRDHLQVPIHEGFALFPGVPVFFIVSGFLVTASLAHCANLGEYLRNRALRIYPGLWAMTAVTVIVLLGFGQITVATPRLMLSAYLLAQVTFLQHAGNGLWLFRQFGTGSVNGALWTIATELQFYVLLPYLFWCASRLSRPRSRYLFFVLLFCASVVLYEVELRPWTAASWDRTALPWLLLTGLYISIPTHLFGFLIGVIFYLQLPLLIRFVQGKFLWWLLGYVAFSLLLWKGFGLIGSQLDKNVFCLLGHRLLLGGLVFSLAYSLPGIAHKLLRGNDISYGVYVYHMLVINSLLQLGLTHAWRYALLVAALTGMIALCSWRWVERPALRLKRRWAPAEKRGVATRAA
jgi:peptidoglycan/LPS O-acetylase OafA/YrhL